MSAIVLTSKPGLQSNSAGLSIPTTWDSTWFKNLVSNLLKGADVRNAIAGPGITITGNISTPYATISAGGAGAPFTAPVIIKTSGGVTVFEVFNRTSGPTVEGYGPTAGGLVDLTPDTGTFTITYTGFTTTVTGTAVWARIGNLVMLFLPTGTGTSNATTFTATGIPAEINPTRAQAMGLAIQNSLEDNGVSVTTPSVVVNPTNTLTFVKAGSAIWTNSGTKGINGANTISYLLN